MFILYIGASLEGTRGSLCGFFYSLQGKLHNGFKNKNFVNSYGCQNGGHAYPRSLSEDVLVCRPQDEVSYHFCMRS